MRPAIPPSLWRSPPSRPRAAPSIPAPISHHCSVAHPAQRRTTPRGSSTGGGRRSPDGRCRWVQMAATCSEQHAIAYTAEAVRFRSVGVLKATPILSDLIRSDPIRSDLIRSDPILSDPIRSYLSDPILSVLMLSYPIRSYLMLSDLFRSYPIRSDPILSYLSDLIRSYLIRSDLFRSDRSPMCTVLLRPLACAIGIGGIGDA